MVVCNYGLGPYIFKKRDVLIRNEHVLLHTWNILKQLETVWAKVEKYQYAYFVTSSAGLKEH